MGARLGGMTVPAAPQAPQQQAPHPQAKIILFLTIFIAMLGLSVLFPIIAPLSRELGLTEIQAGWLATSYSLMQLIFSPIWGARSERIGRKPVLIMGLVGFALSFGLFGYIAHLGMQGVLGGTLLFALLIGSRLIGGMLSSATLPTAQAMMADLSSESERAGAMGLIGAAFGLGVVFGPALGGLLATFGLVAPVLFSAALGLLTAVAGYFMLHETRRPADQASPKGTGARSQTLLKKSGVMTFLILSAVYTLASVSMEQTVAFLVGDRMQLSPRDTAQTVGIMLGVFGLVSAAIQGGAMRRLGKTVPLSRLIPVGTVIMALGMLLLPQAGSFWPFTLALVVIGIGTAILGPSLTTALSLSVGPDDQGAVAGLNSSALALGRMVGPLLGTAMYQQISHGAPYYFAGGLLFALLAYMLLFRPPVPNNVVSAGVAH